MLPVLVWICAPCCKHLIPGNRLCLNRHTGFGGNRSFVNPLSHEGCGKKMQPLRESQGRAVTLATCNRNTRLSTHFPPSAFRIPAIIELFHHLTARWIMAFS